MAKAIVRVRVRIRVKARVSVNAIICCRCGRCCWCFVSSRFILHLLNKLGLLLIVFIYIFLGDEMSWG